MLEVASTQNRIILTNDRDFVSLAADDSHPGIIVYTTATPDPATVARALRRIDRLFDADELTDELLWLTDWV